MNDAWASRNTRDAGFGLPMDYASILSQDITFPLDENMTLTSEKAITHGERVANYCYYLAQALDFSNEAAEQLKQEAVFHDVGKILVPNSILTKPSALTPSEYAQVKEHVVQGYDILRNASSDLLKSSAFLTLKHHENLDGSGYPFGINAEALTLNDRILRVADSFDAITSYRVYRSTRSPEEALQILWQDAEYHFDLKVLKALATVIDENLVSTETLLPQTQDDYVDGLIEKAKDNKDVALN